MYIGSWCIGYKKMMGPTRFERVTSRLSAVRSTWLSYGPGPHSALPVPLITVSLKHPWANVTGRPLPNVRQVLSSSTALNQCSQIMIMVLMDPTNTENNNAKETKETKEDLEGLYDLAIPLSMPVTVIRELVEKFDVEPVLRPGKMDMTGEVMDREILVLRGDLETVKAVEKYMFEALDRKIAQWSSKDREEKYKKYSEEQASLRLKEVKENPEAVNSWELTSE